MIDEIFQSFPPIFDEFRLENTVILIHKGNLFHDCFSRKYRNVDLNIAFHFLSQPFEIAVSSPGGKFFYPEKITITLSLRMLKLGELDYLKIGKLVLMWTS